LAASRRIGRILGLSFFVLAVCLAGARAQSPGFSPPLPVPYQAWQRLQSDPAVLRAFQTRRSAPAATSAPAPAGSPWQFLTKPPPFDAGAMLLLTDGSVLVQESNGGFWARLTPDITGSYVNGTWSQVASLPVGYTPLYYASAILPDGRVIIEGGEYNGSETPVWTNQGAIYDPVANTWTAVQPPSGSGWSLIGDSPSAVLSNGTFMLGGCCSSLTALLNESNLTWAATGSGKAVSNNEESWTLLPNGNVLTVDAVYPQGFCGTDSEIYSPATGQWTSAGSTLVPLADCFGPNPSYEIGPQVLRPDGTVVVFGGTTSGGTDETAIYNSNTGSWEGGPFVPAIGGQFYTLTDAPAALLPSGNILFAASPQPAYTVGTHFFVFTPGNTITQVADDAYAAEIAPFYGFMLVLPTGQILFNGRVGNLEVYNDPNPPNPAWAPVIGSVATTLSTGATYQLSGQQLGGLSQGAAYGDDYQSNTNYPLVKIVNAASGHVFYARTSGFSSMSVAPGNVSSLSFTVPPSYAIEAGPSSLYVIGDGIASQPAGVTIVGASTTSPLVAAVLPESRSVEVGNIATAFATMINSASEPVTGCTITPPGGLRFDFLYQTTDPTTNNVTGQPNTPVNLAGFASQSFVIAALPTAAFSPTNVALRFACTNVPLTPQVTGLNTLLLSASPVPVADIVALGATASRDGLLHIPGSTGSNAFAVATVNLGVKATITATANTGSATLPLDISLCQTDPTSGLCITTIGPSATVDIDANATPTFAIFGQASGAIPFDPADNRIFVQFASPTGEVRGETSVAVTTTQ
jgi:hypothetical protein